MQERLNTIQTFFEANSDQKIKDKYARYFKHDLNCYGIDTNVFKNQKEVWLKEWKEELNFDGFMALSDELVKSGNLEKTSLAIQLTATFKDQFTKETFHHIGTWFTLGFNNWASVDVLCMLVLPHFITQNIITLEELKAWNNAEYEWQRRCVPVTLNELRKTITPSEVFSTIEPIMPDGSEYVQKGIGTLLRTIWKNHPNEVEEFLLKYKDDCGRLIIQYATEKMDKEYRKMFRKTKKQ